LTGQVAFYGQTKHDEGEPAHHVALHLSGRFEEAVRVGELALAMCGRHTWAMGNLAVTFADWGKPADAEALYAELAARGRRSFVSPSWLAVDIVPPGSEHLVYIKGFNA
jgi:hypothetical protein